MSNLTNLEFYVIVPAGRTNLITNPSIETATTGYTAYGTSCAISQSTTYARRGIYSLKATGGSNFNGAYYAVSLTSGTAYTMSVDVRGTAGDTITLAFETTAPAVKASTTLTANGYWQRRSLTWTADSTTTFRLYVFATGSNTLYIDGLQLEAASTQSTYIDGDQDNVLGLLRGVTEFYWTGTAHASTSVRIAETNAGGTLLRIRDYANIVSVIGLGMTSFNTISTQITNGGELYQWSHPNAREFSLVLDFYDATNAGGMMLDVAKVQAALDPAGKRYDQPTRLMVVGYNAAGTIEQTETMLIDCAYAGGLEMSYSKQRTNRQTATFRQFMPLIMAEGVKEQSLTLSTAPTGKGLLKIASDGTASFLSNSGTHGVDKGAFAEASPSVFYYGGDFTNYGDANGDAIVKVTDGVLSSLGSGLNGDVYDLIYRNGTLYACGAFTDAGGVAAADRIAKWDGATWTALGTGAAAGVLITMAISRNGNLYTGGTAIDIGGVAAADKIGMWNGSTWSALSTGLNDTVNDIIADPTGDGVIIAGDFTNAGGTAANDYLVRWDGAAWSILGSAAPNGSVKKLLYDDATGRIYAFGTFTTIGGINANYGAMWDGSQWLSINLSASYAANSETVISQNGTLYLTNGGESNSMVHYRPGNIWIGFPLYTAASAISLYYSKYSNDLYISGTMDSSVSAAYTLAKTAVVNSTYSGVYPVLKLTGPGTVYGIWNYSTGEQITFTGLTMQSGEQLVLKFDAGTVAYFTSNYRGDMRGYITSGSSPAITLLPGSNNIGLFVYGSTDANSLVTMQWADGFRSLEQAVR